MSKTQNAERKVPTYFNPKIIGESLLEMDLNFIQTENDKIVSRWYHGPTDTDLMFWFDSRQNLIKLQILFCGQVVEWNILDGLRTGYVVEEELDPNDSTTSHKIVYDLKINSASVQQTAEIIQNVSLLDEKNRSVAIEHLKNPFKLSQMNVEDIVLKYSNHLAQQDVKTFWKRLKSAWKKVFSS